MKTRTEIIGGNAFRFVESENYEEIMSETCDTWDDARSLMDRSMREYVDLLVHLDALDDDTLTGRSKYLDEQILQASKDSRHPVNNFATSVWGRTFRIIAE